MYKYRYSAQAKYLVQPPATTCATDLHTSYDAIPRVSRICIVPLQNLHVPSQPFAPPLQAISSASRLADKVPASAGECTSTSAACLSVCLSVCLSPPSAVPSARRLGAKKHTILPSASALHLHQQTPRFSKISIALLFRSLPLRALTATR